MRLSRVLSGVDHAKVVEADLRALYVAAYPRLAGAMTLIARNPAEAEDAVQEAFARLVPRWSHISRYDDPEAWVRRVALRVLSNRARQARTGLIAGIRGLSDSAGQPSSEDRVDVARALAALPVNQRQVLVLHHLLDLPVDQVASELRLPVGTVKSRLSRAREALAPLLREGTNRHG